MKNESWAAASVFLCIFLPVCFTENPRIWNVRITSKPTYGWKKSLKSCWCDPVIFRLKSKGTKEAGNKAAETAVPAVLSTVLIWRSSVLRLAAWSGPSWALLKKKKKKWWTQLWLCLRLRPADTTHFYASSRLSSFCKSVVISSELQLSPGRKAQQGCLILSIILWNVLLSPKKSFLKPASPRGWRTTSPSKVAEAVEKFAPRKNSIRKQKSPNLTMAQKS